MSKMSEKNGLVVLEAYSRDVGHGVARIEGQMMKDLGLSKGDIIEIRGRRTTVARCLPGLTPEQLEAERAQLALARQKMHKTEISEKGKLRTEFKWADRDAPVQEMRPITAGRTIRIDGLIRNNAGIAIGDIVAVRKIIAPQAEKVTVVPLEAIPPIDERYLSDALENIPVMKGDNIMVPYFGGRLTFNVTDVVPDILSVVTQKTVFSITTQGTTLRVVGDLKYYSDGKNIAFILEHMVRKETQENSYLVLKIHLHHGGFGRIGELQVKLGKNSSIQEIVSRYKEAAEQVVADANKKLAESSSVNSADLINNIEFEILEKWRTVP